MANPRQRRKAKSSAAPVRHSRRQSKVLRKHRPLRGPKVLVDAWDSHKTADQNYEALGLARSLKPHATGGVDSGASAPLPVNLGDREMPIVDEGLDKKRKTQFGRIIRDDDGNVVSVELPSEDEEDETTKSTPWGQPFEEETATDVISSKNEVVQRLEQMSAGKKSVARYSSEGELATLRALCKAHGRDIESMAHDRRRNVMQRTEGQLRAAIRKAGGFDSLMS